MTPRFIQIHSLTSYPGVLLNRDDAGFAKRLPFGGAIRTRISSQCLKRHWRTFHDGEESLYGLNEPMSLRSRVTFEKYIVEPLVAEGLDAEVVRSVTGALMKEVLGDSGKPKKAKSDEDPTLKTGQITVLGEREVAYLRTLAREAIGEAASDAKGAVAALTTKLKGEGKKNLANLKRGAGLDAALFGRMVTSSYLARGDAAVNVAHAFTVHAQEDETDYFSAVDELKRLDPDEDAGSGHIGSTELTSGLFYSYVVVDVPRLVANLEGCTESEWADADRALSGQVVQKLIQLIFSVSPGAKRGSTAPFAWSQLLMVEAGNEQPRTLANAFQQPIDARGGLLPNAVAEIGSHISKLDRLKGKRPRTRWFIGQEPSLNETLAEASGAVDVGSLDALSSAVAEAVWRGSDE